MKAEHGRQTVRSGGRDRAAAIGGATSKGIEDSGEQRPKLSGSTGAARQPDAVGHRRGQRRMHNHLHK
ncbi:MAG: hypothetical protein GEV03_28455 [Streptosporangiales bacterium]|nr:hypothetical protein [Streptosporangiales bacterium]